MRTFQEHTENSYRGRQRLSVKSALNPILWLCVAATPICLTAGYWMREFPITMGILIALGSLPILISSFGFLYLLFRNPEKLQSEEFQHRHELSQIIKSKSIELGDGATVRLLEEMVRASARQLESEDNK